MALNQTVLAQLEQYQQAGDYSSYYQTLIDNGVAYGTLAMGAATDGNSGNAYADFAGMLANNFLENKYEEVTGNDFTPELAEKVRKELIVADYEYRLKGDVTGDDIANYHYQTFIDLGIPKESWTAEVIHERYGTIAWSLGFLGAEELNGQTPEDAVDTYLDNLFNDFFGLQGDLLGFYQDILLDGVLLKTIDEYGLLNDLSIKFNPLDSLGRLIGSSLFDILNNSDISNAFEQAEVTLSPLVIDLDGDGIETQSQDANVYFDHDINGMAEKTGWVGQDDGLLVLDRNQDGLINDGGELFGNHTQLSDSSNAANGYEALAELDSNQDGVIDAQDAAFSELRVWRDANSDGISQQDELLTLDQAGISSIKTDYSNTSTSDGHGNTIKQTSSATLSDNSTVDTADVKKGTDLFLLNYQIKRRR